MAETRTVDPKGAPLIARDSYFGGFEVPETCSSYRVLVYRSPAWTTIIISVVNWGTSAEFGVWPAEDGMQHSLAEHLFHGNLVDAENLIHVLRHIAATWEV